MSNPVHPLIEQYLVRHGIAPSDRADGRITLLIDDQYRVHLQPYRDGWLALSARLCQLPEEGRARDELLVQLGQLAAGMASRYASGCVVDLREEAIWLQQMISSESGSIDIDEAVGQLANALAFWSDAVRRRT